ncbi:N-acetylneuraminate synthase family protein [bacterium]|nr:N-acetylneuraminate synthase family protein [bacterium]
MNKSNFFKLESTFIIAEIGVNHNGDMDMAKKLILSAKEIGADAVKFQSFKSNLLADTKTPKVEYQKKNTLNSESHYEMLNALELSFDQQAELKYFCDKCNIVFMSTPYDVSSAMFLNEQLDIKCFKLASADIVDIYLHRYIAKTGKPVVISTGMANLSEIEQALSHYPPDFNRNICLLQCTSNYPASDESLNLNVIPMFSKAFNTVVGYSDHSNDDVSALCAVTLGAKVIERHITLDKTLKGPDHAASSTPKELSFYIKNIRRVNAMIGTSVKRIQPEEIEMSNISRKSIVLASDIKVGEIITDDILMLQRPAIDGISPEFISKIIGRKVSRSLPVNHRLTFDDLA